MKRTRIKQTQVILAGAILILQSLRLVAGPMKPIGPMNIEGVIIEISWLSEEFRKGIPGLSGSAGQDRTIPAHYKLKLEGIWKNVKQTSDSKVSRGQLNLRIDHNKNNGFLVKNSYIKISGYKEFGDEGGVHSSYENIEYSIERNKPQIANLSYEEGILKFSVDLKEPFRWQNTKFQSIKTFPMRGGSSLPHIIRLDENHSVNWRQTDVVFSGTYRTRQSSAKDILTQYTEKNGDIGIRTWSIDKDKNLKSFNELTSSYEILTPEEFAAKYGLDFYSNKYSIEAPISGYLVEIIGVFDPETNLLDFDTLDYIPFFQVPKLVIEESQDMKKWSKVKTSNPLPEEYQWPQELTIELGVELNRGAFYRVKIEEE
jgi:hypothetical protein